MTSLTWFCILLCASTFTFQLVSCSILDKSSMINCTGAEITSNLVMNRRELSARGRGGGADVGRHGKNAAVMLHGSSIFLSSIAVSLSFCLIVHSLFRLA